MKIGNFLNLNTIQNALGFKFNPKRFVIYLNNSEVLAGMSVLNYSVRDDSQFIEHPIESGAVIADHHVFNPIEITCNVAFPPKSDKWLGDLGKWTQVSLVDVLYGRGQTFDETFKELATLYSTSTNLSIKTDSGIYTNMYITSIPTDVSPDNADRQIFQITFKEAITVTPQYIKIDATKARNASNGSYVKTGEVLPANVSSEQNKSVLEILLG